MKWLYSDQKNKNMIYKVEIPLFKTYFQSFYINTCADGTDTIL